MVLRRHLPSANALFTFEAAARLGSFSRAARELNVTQPAVSHAIALLERHIGQPLYLRAGPRIELTEAGERLARATTRAFGTIEEALTEVTSAEGGRDVVMLSISTGMVAHWLMPRWGAFRLAFPTVDLQFQMIAISVGGPLNGCDIGLRAATGAEARRLGGWFAPERVLVAGAPAYLRERGNLDRRGHTLIALSEHWFGWNNFADAAGFRLPPAHERLGFSDYAIVLQAAVNGQGLALAWTSVAARLLIDGMLSRASPHLVQTERSYHLVINPQRAARPVVRRVRDWLIEEMSREEEELGKLLF